MTSSCRRHDATRCRGDVTPRPSKSLTTNTIRRAHLSWTLNISEVVFNVSDHCDILRGLSYAMSSQTLIIQHPASGGADCEQTGKPGVVVEMLTGDMAGVKVVIPMSPIFMDNCKGMSTSVCSYTEMFTCLDLGLLREFKTYVLPVIKYTCNVWSPHYAANIRKVERVQRKFAKRLLGCSKLSYPDRLARLKLESLEVRRL